MRTAPEGAALWTSAPDPEMLTHLCIACGRDGASQAAAALLTGPPKGLRAGRVNAELIR